MGAEKADKRVDTIRALRAAKVATSSSVATVVRVGAGADVVAVSSGSGAAAVTMSLGRNVQCDQDAAHASQWASVVTTENAVQSIEANPTAAIAAARLLIMTKFELDTIEEARMSSTDGDFAPAVCADALALALERDSDGKLAFVGIQSPAVDEYTFAAASALADTVQVVVLHLKNSAGFAVFADRRTGSVWVYDCDTDTPMSVAALLKSCTKIVAFMNDHIIKDESWKPKDASE
jgi:hypothetical protein